MKIVTVRVGEEPKVESFDGSLASMQAIVGGDIGIMSIGDGIDLVYNDNGIAEGLKENGWGILGTYFFVGHNGAGDSVGLTDEQCGRLMALAVSRRGVRHGGGSMTVESFDSLGDLLKRLEQKRFDDDHAN